MPAILFNHLGTSRPNDMKQRYVTLDAMRGVAALFVVARHFGGLHGVRETQFSYLAVDLFFLLSGFVLSLSYGDRLASGMSSAEFLIRRVIRLYPLYLIGISISIAIALFDVSSGDVHAPTMATWAAISGFGLLMLPSPTQYFSSNIFPILVPAWSLFFELFVANVLFAVLRGRERIFQIAVVTVLSAVILLLAGWLHRSLDIGATWGTFVGGFPRVGFSFFAGVLLQRWHRAHPPRLRMPSWLMLLILALVLLPSIGGLPGLVYEYACVLFVFPALVFWGAEAVERHGWIGTALGDTSYALYVIHYPLVVLVGRALIGTNLYPGRWAELLFFTMIVPIAYALHRFYDEPLRAAITRWRVQRKSHQVAAI
ncbi:MAG: acyltransferase [Alphaproteobacteria bacterium]|nr:acyltransferase [Alphaproteobacteria bacterium]